MNSTTYAGSKIAVIASLPATYDAAGYAALSWPTDGECALHEVPAIKRSRQPVNVPLVCRDTTSDIKGQARWDPMTVKLSGLIADPQQVIYESLEADETGVGSFRVTLKNGQIKYFTAMVNEFAEVDGGSGDTVHSRTAMLLIQSNEVVSVDPS